ncbi:MAG: hypothetical protein GSR79_03935 [Desulfurococcales archaeon]|nr:hypothetical protein [Desulfurococcales archaeon]
MQWKKHLMLATVLLLALSMAAGAYHTEAATQVSSQAIVLTQQTSVGGKLFFVIDVQKLRQSYPQAVAVNVFMDTNAFASIGSTSVPLIYDSQYYVENGVNLTVPYAEHLKLDTSGVGENLLIVSLQLPADNSWWAKVSEMTGVDYASASTVYLKIQIDQNTVAVMDGHFSLSNNTLIGKYQISDTKFSYTGFNATWYGGPATTNMATGSIQLFHGDGTPLNLTAGDASWIKYQVKAYNGHEGYYVFNITMTPSGIVDNSSEMFYFANVTYSNVSTSQVKFSLGDLAEFPATPTATESHGGVVFPYSEFKELLYTVQISPILDEHYNNSFDAANDIVIVNLTSTSYLNLTLVDTNTVFAMGELSDGITGTLTYYTYNSTADEFENPDATPANYSVDYVFNQTSDQAYVIYLINWNEAPSLKVYPSVVLDYNETHIVEGTDALLGSQMNPGDLFVVTGHNLPYPANFSTVCLAGWDGENFTVFSTDVYTPGTDSQVNSDGTLTATVYVANHPYGGKMFYPILRVNVTGTLYRTWVDDAQGMNIYPYVTAEYLDNDGYWNTVDGEQLAPGDYILIKGYGFITTEDLTPFVSYDTSNITNALHALITLTNVQGLDTDGDGMIDAYKVTDDTTGEIALVVKLPADINMTKLASGFVFGLKGSGDNVGFSNVTADSVAYGVGNEKVFLWPYGDNVARFFGNTTSLDIFSYLNDLTVYPYEAYEYIQGVEKSDVMAYVEIIGFSLFDNATVDVNLEDGMFYKVTSFNATDLVQGYKELAIKVPTLPGDYYYAYVNESNSTSYYDDQYSSYALNITCIIGYKVSGSNAYELLTGTITARPGANVTFIGYGLDANAETTIYSDVPYIGPALADVYTDDYGTFNVTISTSYILQLTGRDSGVFQLELDTSPPACTKIFSLIVSEKPLFKISVKADPNAFVGQTIYVSVKLLLQYKTEEVPMLSQPESVAKFQYLTLWFIYGSGDVDVVNITDLSTAPVVYVNPTTSEIVVSYVIEHQPINDVLVVDALAGASIFGGYFNSVATDHAVVSVDTALNNLLLDAKTLAGEAKTAADNAASAAQQAASAASDAKTAASNAANAAQQAATAAQNAVSAAQQAASAASDAKTAASNAANAAQQAATAAQQAATAASNAQKSASDAAQKVTQVGDNLAKNIQDVSSKVDAVGNKAASGIKTYGLINMILIIITLIVALYLVAKMKP